MNIDPMTNVVFVCDRPHLAHRCSEAWRKLHPAAPFVAVVTCTTSPSGYPLHLPRELPISEAPSIREPAYRTDIPLRVYARGGRHDHLEELDGADARSLVRNADTIVCAVDADAQGAHSFRNLIRHSLQDKGDELQFPWLRVLSFDEDTLIEALKAPESTAHPDFAKAVGMIDAKRFFEMNWACNALPVLGKALEGVGADGADRFVSKYALQVLFWLEGQETLSFGKAVRKMSQWTGTGKYSDLYPEGAVQVGSPTSRHVILDQLTDKGLLSYQGEQGLTRKPITISDRGRQFLAALHPKMRDPDLPFRIENWGQTWPESRRAMERYIRTVFGRQKRFRGKAA